MTRHVGAVVFEDSTRLYLIYDSTMDAAMRPLFPTAKAARNWHESGAPEVNRQNEAGVSEEAVTIITDVALEKEEGKPYVAGSFASRASKKTMWLTGPRSFMEMVYENGATACRVY